jgi:signal transduction histidine kinase
MISTINCIAQMQIKQVLVNGKVIEPTQKINLSATNNDLVLDFEPSKNDSTKYFFRIKELNANWTQSLYPSAHYQNLKGGKYTFQIFAKYKNISPKTATISVEVKESFWQKSWFLPAAILYGLLIVGFGIYLFFLYDFRQKLKLQHIRNQIASDLHDEVGSNLNSIAIFVELLRKKIKLGSTELLPILNKIADSSEETVLLMQDTVWAINPVNDSNEKLFEKMRSFGVEMLSAKGIPFDFVNEIDVKKDIFSMEQRRNLYLIYKEAINNIAKHAQATKASCQISTHQSTTKISITDNGRGFDLTKTFEGNGLKNFKIRSQEDDLKVFISSELQKGTTILIQILAQ